VSPDRSIPVHKASAVILPTLRCGGLARPGLNYIALSQPEVGAMGLLLAVDLLVALLQRWLKALNPLPGIVHVPIKLVPKVQPPNPMHRERAIHGESNTICRTSRVESRTA
jgi:hypothetical protein